MRHRSLCSLVFIGYAGVLGAGACARSPGESSTVQLSTPFTGSTPGSTTHTSPALQDGSFEQGGVGWQLSDASVVDVGLGAYHGTKALLIEPLGDPGLRHGSARVVIPTEVGREYLLSFAYQAGFELGTALLAVAIDGSAPGNVAAVAHLFDPGVARDVPSRSGWIQKQVSFFAERELTGLQLGPLSRWNASLGWGKVWLDQVKIEPLDQRRALGTDVDVRATLPSVVQAGEEVELRVSLAGALRKDPTSGGGFDTRPVHHRGEFLLASDDPAAVLPPRIRFDGEATRVERLRFGTSGIHRLTLSTADGFTVLSNPVLVQGAATELCAYWGDIHVHTAEGHADWVGGDGAANYTFARDFADLDFAALSEHFDPRIAVDWVERLAPVAQSFDEPGRFATFLAAESFSYQGHTNYYLRGDEPLALFDPRNPLGSRDSQLANLRSRNVPVLAIPHHFMLLDPADWRATDRGALRLAEIYSLHGSSEEAGAWWRHPSDYGFAYTDSRGARGHDFRTALARGQRIGAIACSDSHELQPGMAGLTCVRASELTRRALWDALYRRECYATSGERILLELEIAGVPMGSEIFVAPGSPLSARVAVHGQALLQDVELVSAGKVVAAAHPGTLDFNGTLELGSYSGQPICFYARVRQRNEQRAWSSPIWIDPAGRANLVLEERDLGYDHGSRTLSVTPRNYGDTPAGAALRFYSSAQEPSFAVVEPGSFAQPTLLVRIEPVNSHRVRLLGALYLPRHLGKSVGFSGLLQILRANGGRVVADPRGMLVDQGNGTLAWDDLLGVEYKALDSRSGQLTDFELLIDTRPDTVVTLAARIDGTPLAAVYVGSELHGAPLLVTIPVGRIASVPPLAQEQVAPPAHGVTTRFEIPDIAPGATYIAVLDPNELVVESDEDDNGSALAVPETPLPYSHWPEYSGLQAGGSGSAPAQSADADSCGQGQE